MTNILMAEQDLGQMAKMRDRLEAAPHHYNLYWATTARECLELIELHAIDIIILDADLPDQSGVALVQQIRETAGYEFVWVIMMSPDKDQETDAYKKAHCYDYIIKPYDVEALFHTIAMLGRYKTTFVVKEDRDFVTFRQRDQFIRVLNKDILYIEVIGNNSTLYTYSQVYCLKKMSLKRLKLMLPDYFVQCHKSFIVNRNYIESIQKGPYGWEIYLKNYDRSVPSGEKYKGNVTKFPEIG